MSRLHPKETPHLLHKGVLLVPCRHGGDPFRSSLGISLASSDGSRPDSQFHTHLQQTAFGLWTVVGAPRAARRSAAAGLAPAPLPLFLCHCHAAVCSRCSARSLALVVSSPRCLPASASPPSPCKNRHLSTHASAPHPSTSPLCLDRLASAFPRGLQISMRRALP